MCTVYNPSRPPEFLSSAKIEVRTELVFDTHHTEREKRANIGDSHGICVVGLVFLHVINDFISFAEQFQCVCM